MMGGQPTSNKKVLCISCCLDDCEAQNFLWSCPKQPVLPVVFRRRGSGPIFHHISPGCGEMGHEVSKSVHCALRIGQQTLKAEGTIPLGHIGRASSTLVIHRRSENWGRPRILESYLERLRLWLFSRLVLLLEPFKQTCAQEFLFSCVTVITL